MNLSFIPQPQRLQFHEGSFPIPTESTMGISDASFYPVARELQSIWPSLASSLPIRICHPKFLDTIRINLSSELSAEAYRLKIDAHGVHVEAGSETGAFHAVQTLRQIFRQLRDGFLPFLEIHDWPDFAERGLYYDVCRGRVPKLERLFELVELLSYYKINQFQLYIEHTFAFRGHPDIGCEASPLTADDILSLDAHCRSRRMELVPSLASFGHLSNVLKNPRYQSLAEDFGVGKYLSPDAPEDFSHTGWSLSPANPDIYPFLDSLYAEFLPLFSSKRFNACCDETFDLGWGQSYELCRERGKGRVYLDHIKKINDLSKKYGKSLMIWGDIIRQYPELVSEIPKDVTVLDWVYGYENRFDSLSDFQAAGLKFLACPGTSSWLGLFPRLPQARANISGFACAAKNYGAAGLLNTDWGDGGHYNFMENSWHGYLFGAEQSWNPQAEQSDFTRRFVTAFFGYDDPALAAALDELGDISFTCPAGGGAGIWQDILFALPDNPLFQTIASDKGTYISDGKIVTDRNRLDAASLRELLERLGAIRSIFSSRPENADPQGVLPYWIYAVDATRLAVRRLLEYGAGGSANPEERRLIQKDLRNLSRSFQRLWMDRNRTSEIGITLARFDRVIRGDSLRVQLEETAHGPLRVTVTNHGLRKASGVVSLQSFPEGALRFDGESELLFPNLRPGSSQSADFPFQLAQGVEKCVVKTSNTNPNVTKGVLGIFRRKALQVSEFQSLPDGGAELAGFLSEHGASCHLVRDGSPLAEAWIALDSNAIALLVAARDYSITRAQPVWKGSCFELFAKREDSEIAQIFLCPSTPDSPAAAFELDRSAVAIVPAPAIAVEELGSDGKHYQLVAKVPLSILKMPPHLNDFRMEMVLTSVTSSGHGYQRTSLFHPVEDPSTNCRGFGFVQVKKPV